MMSGAKTHQAALLGGGALFQLRALQGSRYGRQGGQTGGMLQCIAFIEAPMNKTRTSSEFGIANASFISKYVFIGYEVCSDESALAGKKIIIGDRVEGPVDAETYRSARGYRARIIFCRNDRRIQFVAQPFTRHDLACAPHTHILYRRLANVSNYIVHAQKIEIEGLYNRYFGTEVTAQFFPGDISLDVGACSSLGESRARQIHRPQNPECPKAGNNDLEYAKGDYALVGAFDTALNLMGLPCGRGALLLKRFGTGGANEKGTSKRRRHEVVFQHAFPSLAASHSTSFCGVTP